MNVCCPCFEGAGSSLISESTTMGGGIASLPFISGAVVPNALPIQRLVAYSPLPLCALKCILLVRLVPDDKEE